MSPSVQEEETTRVSESSGSASGNGIGLAPSPPVTGANTRSSGNSESRNGFTPDLPVTGAGAQSSLSTDTVFGRHGSGETSDRVGGAMPTTTVASIKARKSCTRSKPNFRRTLDLRRQQMNAGKESDTVTEGEA